jgi:YfiH family protein
MSFHLHEQNGVVYQTADTLLLPGVIHGFSTRKGGVSPAPWDSLNLGPSRGDEPARVQENYRRFCDALGVDVQRIVLSRQVHETNVRLVTQTDAGKGLWRERDYDSVDAMICQTPGLSLVVFSADCGILLLYDPVHRAVGACHAGWRGAAAGIAAKTVCAMRDAFGTNPSDLRSAIGAGIGSCCFETDSDVPQAMEQALGVQAAAPYLEKWGEKWHVDLKGINSFWLQRAGVPAAHIDVCPDCTACRPELYWSHRKMGQQRGVQAALISLCE